MKLRNLVPAVLVAVSVGLPCASLYLHWNDPPEASKVAEAKKQADVRKECAAARQKHDQLYRGGVARPDEQVDVRAACEPDKVAQETAAWCILAAFLIAGAVMMLPHLLGTLAPR